MGPFEILRRSNAKVDYSRDHVKALDLNMRQFKRCQLLNTKVVYVASRQHDCDLDTRRLKLRKPLEVVA